MKNLDDVRRVLASILGLSAGADSLTAATRLVGNLPEFDSMAVVSVVTALEEHFGIEISDEEINADVFESVGSVATFIEQKTSV